MDPGGLSVLAGGCSRFCHSLWLGWSPPAIIGCLWMWSWWTSTTGGIRVASGCSAARLRAACQVSVPRERWACFFSKSGRPLVDPLSHCPWCGGLNAISLPTPPYLGFVLTFLFCSSLSPAQFSAHSCPPALPCPVWSFPYILLPFRTGKTPHHQGSALGAAYLRG